jgi:hypothetical protein
MATWMLRSVSFGRSLAGAALLLSTAVLQLGIGSGPAPPFHTLVCPFPLPDVDLERPLERCNVRATSHTGPANEISLAMDPVDPQHLVLVAKDYNYTRNLRVFGNPQLPPQATVGPITVFATTFDGGATWTEGYLQPLTEVVGNLPGIGPVGDTADKESDPVVTFLADGSVLGVTLPTRDRRLHAYLSDDGGRTFSHAGFPHPGRTDKEWVAVDPQTGTLYMTSWNGGGTDFQRSVDGGRTWSLLRLDECPYAGLSVGHSGRVYVAGWCGFPDEFIDVRWSDDSGATWSPVVHVAELRAGNGLLDLRALFRHALLPQVAASPSTQDVAVAWQEIAPGQPHACVLGFCANVAADDVFVSVSHDGGQSWVAPHRLNDDLTDLASQFMPQVAFSPNGRDLHAAWIDQRLDQSGQLVEVYYAHSPDGGETWDANLDLSDAPFLAALSHHQTLAVFIGDYFGLQASNDRAVIAFPDTRYGRADVFLATVT